jgi:hypothetical protein
VTRASGHMCVRLTLRRALPEDVAALQLDVIITDYLELRRRLAIAGVPRFSERQASWFDALTPHGTLTSIDLSEVIAIEEIRETPPEA